MNKELPACPVEVTLMMVVNRWTIPALRELLTGPKRFSELKRGIQGVSHHSLSNCLRNMEENGLISRTVYPEVPPRVVYELTELGLSLRPMLDFMEEWGTTYQERAAQKKASGTPEAD